MKRRKQKKPPVKEPLAGIRVIDLTQVYAGPLAARILADLGAEVIKIESAMRSTRGGPNPQPGAIYPGGDPGPRPYNRSAYYNEVNRGKLAISLDLSKEKGRDLFKRLTAISDIVIENFSPRVMANFGLDYPALRKVNPRVIMISISAYGATGPYHNYVSFGRGIEAISGLSALTGYPGGAPLGPGIAYADATGGRHAALAALLALRKRSRTGKGSHVDLSLRESLLMLIGERFIIPNTSQAPEEPLGNDDGTALFSGCYRCCGEDEWITVVINSENDLEQLRRTIGGALLNDKRSFGSILDFLQNRADADREIERWTQERSAEEVTEILRGKGIAVGAVRDAAAVFADPHLRTRGFFEQVSHPEAGTHDYPAALPGWNQARPAPLFAEHNSYVFKEILGLSDLQLQQLETEGIISRAPQQ